MELSSTLPFQVREGRIVEVERDVLDIVAQVKAIDPRVKVYYNEQRNVFDLVEDCLDGNLRLIFSVDRLDSRVVRRLQAADHWHGRQDPEHVLGDDEDYLARIDEADEAEKRELEADEADARMTVGEQLAWALEQDRKGTHAQISVKKELPHASDESS